MKQAQIQQYRHLSDIIDITLLLPLLSPYLLHTPLQSPQEFYKDQKKHFIWGVVLVQVQSYWTDVGMVLKFYISMVKRLKLKVRVIHFKFLRL